MQILLEICLILFEIFLKLFQNSSTSFRIFFFYFHKLNPKCTFNFPDNYPSYFFRNFTSKFNTVYLKFTSALLKICSYFSNNLLKFPKNCSNVSKFSCKFTSKFSETFQKMYQYKNGVNEFFQERKSKSFVINKNKFFFSFFLRKRIGPAKFFFFLNLSKTNQEFEQNFRKLWKNIRQNLWISV